MIYLDFRLSHNFIYAPESKMMEIILFDFILFWNDNRYVPNMMLDLIFMLIVEYISNHSRIVRLLIS